MAEDETLVEASNITKDYHLGGAIVTAVRDVSLSVRPGAFTVISGPSGSGKSTLLHLLGCLDKPTTGALRVAGENVSSMSDRDLSGFRARKLGFIFQNFNLIPVLTAWENVEYALRINRVPRPESKQRAMELLASVGLERHASHRPTQLSGGQCQRVAIARALVTRPALVLADEPTANLDSATGALIIDLMHDLKNKTGTSFVIATHDHMVASRAEQRIAMRDGRIEPNP
jgi:putative ABC transport system ATP-binding protein